MALTLSFDNICTALTTCGYVVNKADQEKITEGGKEIVVTMLDVDLNVESFASYEMPVTVGIMFKVDNPNNIVTLIANMCSKLDKEIAQPSFKFGKPSINKLGQTYKVVVIVNYKEIVNVDEE